MSTDTTETTKPERRRRRTSLTMQPQFQAQMRSWRADARPWLRGKVDEFLASRIKDDQDFTSGDVLNFLDDQTDQPPGYSMLAQVYSSRYNVVRTALESMVKEGVLDHKETVNIRGVKSVGYVKHQEGAPIVEAPPPRRARGTSPTSSPAQQFSVVVDADANKDAIEARVQAFLEQHVDLLGSGFRGLLLSRK